MSAVVAPSNKARTGALRGLGLRLALKSLLAALMIGLLLSVVVVFVLYQRSVIELEQRYSEVERGHLPGLVEALWEVDETRIEIALEALQQLTDVAALDLEDERGRRWRWRAEGEWRELRRSSFTLVHEAAEERVKVGELEVSLGDQRLSARLWRDALLSLGVLIGSQLAVALVFLQLFRSEVGSHLRGMADYARALRVDSLATPLTLRRPFRPGDELDDVVAAVNAMREGFSAELVQRKRLQAALDAHLLELEIRVEERTAALSIEAQRASAALLELERAQVALEALARSDALTELPNRRAMTERLEAEQLRGQRSSTTFAVVLADIDHFKGINDRHGHDAGDIVLREIAVRLRSDLRAQDQAGRWGGEEFLILLPDTDLDGARVVAEKVRSLIAAAPVSLGSTSVSVSVTQGVAVSDGREPLVSLLKRADMALYRGKAAGRNCVEVA